jgi:hypothetical protein
MLISDKALYVASPDGPVVRFEAGVARVVPPSIIQLCESMGAYPVGEKPKSAPAEDVVDAVSDSDRAIEIVSAIGQLLDQGKTKNFSKTGEPKVRSIEAILGYDITADERDAAWAEMGES